MNNEDEPDGLLITPRQRAILKVLVDAGMTESGEHADGRRFEDAPPEGLAMMIDFALDAAASEDDLLGIITLGNRVLVTELRPLERSLMAVRD
jgi:hypothetical protein